MVSLLPDEHILITDEAKYYGTKGKLYLTNKKIAFEYEKGIIFKGKYSSINIPLDRISEVDIVGVGPFRKITISSIRDQSSFGIPRHEFNVRKPETWKAKIEVAKSTPTDRISKEREVIVKETVKVKCTYCGMLVEQTLSRCPNCGGLLTR